MHKILILDSHIRSTICFRPRVYLDLGSQDWLLLQPVNIFDTLVVSFWGLSSKIRLELHALLLVVIYVFLTLVFMLLKNRQCIKRIETFFFAVRKQLRYLSCNYLIIRLLLYLCQTLTILMFGHLHSGYRNMYWWLHFLRLLALTSWMLSQFLDARHNLFFI